MPLRFFLKGSQQPPPNTCSELILPVMHLWPFHSFVESKSYRVGSLFQAWSYVSSGNMKEKNRGPSWVLLVSWGNKQEEAIPSLHLSHPTLNKYFSFLFISAFSFFTRIFGWFPHYLWENFFSSCFAGCPFYPGRIKWWACLGFLLCCLLSLLCSLLLDCTIYSQGFITTHTSIVHKSEVHPSPLTWASGLFNSQSTYSQRPWT